MRWRASCLIYFSVGSAITGIARRLTGDLLRSARLFGSVGLRGAVPPGKDYVTASGRQGDLQAGLWLHLPYEAAVLLVLVIKTVVVTFEKETAA